MKRDPFFFIGILPPKDLQREVTEFKKYIADTWGPLHAFKSPPHLTLHPPFAWPERRLPPLTRSLQSFAADHTSFPIQLQGFGAFPLRVIFIQVLENPLLNTLFQDLVAHLETTLSFADQRNHHPFHPHMTIAHRDVEEAVFPTMWRHFSAQSYERVFEVEALSLLESVNGRWIERETFALKKEG